MTKQVKMKFSALLLTVATLTVLTLAACQSKAPSAAKVIDTHRGGNMAIVLSNDKGELTQGQDQFVVAFRSAADNKPADAGKASVTATMSMPGMSPMSAGIELTPTGAPGEYAAKGDFGMSGSWRFEVRWDGPAGQGSTVFNTSVR